MRQGIARQSEKDMGQNEKNETMIFEGRSKLKTEADRIKTKAIHQREREVKAQRKVERVIVRNESKWGDRRQYEGAKQRKKNLARRVGSELTWWSLRSI